MSEYQYYEWQTIDRPLTASEQRAVDGLSSHMDAVTSTQAIVTYSWGDFKHDPRQVLLKHFDTFLYDSNFGTRQLMFRLPKNLVDVPAFQPYLFEDQITLEAHGKCYVLEIRIDEESDYFEWVESESVLGQLVLLREQLLQGDWRMLYLAWLKVISRDEREGMDEESEPPLPAGVKKLNSSLQAFADFFGIDPHLISAAAAASPKGGSAPEPDLEAAIAKLTRAESDALLLQIARSEPGAVLALKKRLTQSLGARSAAASQASRSAADLMAQARGIDLDAKCRAQAKAERQRIERLEELARTEEAVWARIEDLLSQKRSSAYDEATKLLCELRDMSHYK
jgi:hypothetical protein